jgi:uncharacterized protein YndB with AHSA1/START domain
MTESDREIVGTRVLAWPRERVFGAWPGFPGTGAI